MKKTTVGKHILLFVAWLGVSYFLAVFYGFSLVDDLDFNWTVTWYQPTYVVLVVSSLMFIALGAPARRVVAISGVLILLTPLAYWELVGALVRVDFGPVDVSGPVVGWAVLPVMLELLLVLGLAALSARAKRSRASD